MKENTKQKLEEAIVACANAATNSATSLEALQYTQAAQNAANALIGLKMLSRNESSISQCCDKIKIKTINKV